MPSIRDLLLTVSLALSPAPALPQTAPADADYACQTGAQLPYPPRAAIRDRGILLSLTAQRDMLSDPASLPHPLTPEMLENTREWQRQDAAEKTETLARLAAMPQVERDVTLLSALDRSMVGDRPVALLVTQIDDRFLSLYLDVMDRNGLTQQADAVRAGRALFGPGTLDARARNDLWIAPVTFTMNEPLDVALQKIDAAVAPTLPEIIRTAERVAQHDPQFSAALAAEAGKIDEIIYLDWIAGQILQCATPIQRTRDGDPFAALPQPQHDLLILDIFMGEVMNGGTHQFLSNNSGDLAPEVHKILLRHDLPEHAAELNTAMEMLGMPYPRDRTVRSKVIDGFDDAGNEALNAPTGIMDDGAVYRAMLKMARTSGLMIE